MSAQNHQSPGTALAAKLFQALAAVTSTLLPGARNLPLLDGLNERGHYLFPVENVRVKATQILVQSQRVFAHGTSLKLEMGTGTDNPRLVLLAESNRIETGAEDHLANVFLCQDDASQFPPPRKFVDLLLRAEPTIQELPRIEHYSKTALFDDQFVLHGPGWHPDKGILIHGPDISPALHQPGSLTLAALDRLPPHLHELLKDFCFQDDASVANAVGFLLTGLLPNHFIATSKPIGLLDGNQPGVGKTLLARTVGMVIGGSDPPLIKYTPDDEELQKQILSTIRSNGPATLIFDNAKLKGAASAVNSATIESNSMAPELSLRILGQSANHTCPNSFLWMITKNGTLISSDMASRSLPIRLSYDGNPKDRAFIGPDPIEYARTYRLEILSELAGMITRWNQQGRPPGTATHRCSYWANIVGGILQVANLPEFLTNADQAAAEFNSELEELAALAEAAAKQPGIFAEIMS